MERTFKGPRRWQITISAKSSGRGLLGGSGVIEPADDSVVTKGVAKVGSKPVALKKLLIHNPRDGVSVTTIREIKILKVLNHRNVVPLMDMVVEPSACRLYDPTVADRRTRRKVESPRHIHGLSVHGPRSLWSTREQKVQDGPLHRQAIHAAIARGDGIHSRRESDLAKLAQLTEEQHCPPRYKNHQHPRQPKRRSDDRRLWSRAGLGGYSSATPGERVHKHGRHKVVSCARVVIG